MADIAGILVDTSVWSRVETNPLVAELLAKKLQAAVVYTCPVVDLELLYSARSLKEYERWRVARRAGYASVQLLPEIGERALQVQRLLARKGMHRAVKLADLLVAACAESVKATVVHYDSDYDHISALTKQRVEWIAPRGSMD